MMESAKRQSGLIKFLLLVIIVILLLNYLKIDLRGLLDSETVQETIKSIWLISKDFILKIWDDYLSGPASFLWRKIDKN